jgi:hypothetical protein
VDTAPAPIHYRAPRFLLSRYWRRCALAPLAPLAAPLAPLAPHATLSTEAA